MTWHMRAQHRPAGLDRVAHAFARRAHAADSTLEISLAIKPHGAPEADLS